MERTVNGRAHMVTAQVEGYRLSNRNNGGERRIKGLT